MLFNKSYIARFFRGVVPFLKVWRKPIQCSKRYKSEKEQCVCTKIKTNTPHPPRDPPANYNPACVEHCGFKAPENVQPLVFRPLGKNDILGPNASKEKTYKNPEYFAYHRFSHVDLFMNAMRIRMEKRLEQMCPGAAKKKKACLCQVCGCEVCTCGDNCKCAEKEASDKKQSCEAQTSKEEQKSCDKPKTEACKPSKQSDNPCVCDYDSKKCPD